jgi:hypothetical protein
MREARTAVCPSTDLCAANWPARSNTRSRRDAMNKAGEGNDETPSRISAEPSAPLSLSARTLTAENQRSTCAPGNLRRAFQRDDRQMPLATQVLDLQCESTSGLSRDQRMRPGAARTTRPAYARLDARSSVGGPQSEVDFARRSTGERRVRLPRLVHAAGAARRAQPASEIQSPRFEVTRDARLARDASRAFSFGFPLFGDVPPL